MDAKRARAADPRAGRGETAADVTARVVGGPALDLAKRVAREQGALSGGRRCCKLWTVTAARASGFEPHVAHKPGPAVAAALCFGRQPPA